MVLAAPCRGRTSETEAESEYPDTSRSSSMTSGGSSALRGTVRWEGASESLL